MSGDATSAVGCDSLTSINAVNCSASNATRQGMPHAPLLNIVHDVPRRVVFTRAALLADQRTGAHYDKRKVGDGDIVVAPVATSQIDLEWYVAFAAIAVPSLRDESSSTVRAGDLC